MLTGQFQHNTLAEKHLNFTIDVVDEWATRNPDKLALLWFGGDSVSKFNFKKLSTLSSQMAHFFTQFGIVKGDTVMLMLPRIPEWWICVLALIKIGAVVSPSATSLRARDLQYRCKSANIKMVVTYPGAVEQFEAIDGEFLKDKRFLLCGKLPTASKLRWIPLSDYEQFPTEFKPSYSTLASDPMLVYFTSGTTGFPKMVMHRQSYSMAHRYTAQIWQDLNPNDIIYCITDTGWAKSAYSTIFGQWFVGACVFVYGTDKFEPKSVLEILEKFEITVFCAPPTAYRKLILEDIKRYNLHRLRHCVSAGEPLNPEANRKWQEATKLPIYEAYGQTETTVVISSQKEDFLKPGSMGKAMPFLTVAIIDDDLQPCPTGVEGNIAIKVKPHQPLGCFEGYLGENSAQKNSEVFRGDWYLTGDRAYVDSDGYYWFVSRSDDVIKSSGYRIGPFEVESAFLTHGAVVEAAVVGVPHATRGHVIKAFVVLKQEYRDRVNIVNDLKEHCKKELPHYQIPSIIEIVDDLPKTVSGKIRRTELREKEKSKL